MARGRGGLPQSFQSSIASLSWIQINAVSAQRFEAWNHPPQP